MQPPNADFIDLRDVLTVLHRQIRLIGFAVFACVIAAFIFLVIATPRYTATALVQVNPNGVNVLTGAQQQLGVSDANARLESEVEILKTEGLALATVQANDLVLDASFGPSLGVGDKIRLALGIEQKVEPNGSQVLRETLDKFRDALEIRRRGLTYLIGVSVSARSPDDAAKLANAHADTYIAAQISTKVAASNSARDVIQSQLAHARQALAATDAALGEYFNLYLAQLEAETGSAEVARLRALLQGSRQDADARRAKLASMREAIALQDWDALARDVEQAAIEKLALERAQILRRLNGNDAQGDLSFDLNQSLARIESDLQSASLGAVSSLEAEVQHLGQTSTQLEADIRRALLEGGLSPQALSEIYGLQQEAQIAQQQHDRLLSRLREIETQAPMEVADSTVISKALPPRSASFPNRTVVFSLALLVGTVLGVCLAFAYEFFQGGVTSATQLEGIFAGSVGAIIPQVSSKSGERSVADRIVSEPMSPFSEGFRRLRASIDRTTGAQPDRGRVIMMASALASEGKSTCALALARSYAMAGKRTLLIDADLRNPSQNMLVGEMPEHGILEYLSNGNGEDLGDAMFDLDPKTPLVMLLGKEAATIPTEGLLRSQGFLALLEHARNALDVIIIDTAPILPVMDATYIAPLADCIVLCVKFGTSAQSDVRSAQAQLADYLGVGTKIIPALNRHETVGNPKRYAGYYG